MHDEYRKAYNEVFDEELYRDFVGGMERRLSCTIPFRVAETPVFFSTALRERLESDASGVLDEITTPAFLKKMEGAVPEKFRAAGCDAMPHCMQVDLAIVRDPQGELTGKVVELQAFPSLYALMVFQLEEITRVMRARSKVLDRDWSIYFGGMTRDQFVEKLRASVLGDLDPDDVVLLDLDPEHQKTYPDFLATKALLGVDPVCPTTLTKEGNKLIRVKDGKKRQVRRIYNRIVFDELEAKATSLPFDYRDELDVSWFSHPNWYWTFSKYSLPHITHAAVPKTTKLSELSELPADLSKYVLKPLFSFAGAGVKVDVEKADVDAVPSDQRAGWVLQEKVAYEPALKMPDGGGVKAEVRMMFLRGPSEERPSLALNLCRLSRGKMLGVDHNRDMTWVGGSIGIWPRD